MVLQDKRTAALGAVYLALNELMAKDVVPTMANTLPLALQYGKQTSTTELIGDCCHVINFNRLERYIKGED